MYSLQSEIHEVFVGAFFILKTHPFLIHLDSRKENLRPFSGDFYLSDDNVSLQRPSWTVQKDVKHLFQGHRYFTGVTGRGMEEMGNVGA